MSGLLELLLLTGLLLGAATWGLVHLGVAWDRKHPIIHRDSSKLLRCASARLLLYSPVWLPLFLLMSALLPSLLHATWGVGMDHCLTHGTGHHHLCLIHPPHLAHQSVVWALAALILATIAWRGVRHGHRLREQWQMTRALLVWTQVDTNLGSDVHVVTHDRPFVFVTGWFSSRIVLSTGFLNRCCVTTLDVVLAHERAHIARRDTFWSTLDRAMALVFLAPFSARLLHHLALAQEQACDQQAVRVVGNPMTVAQALVEVAALSMTAPPGTHSIVSSTLESRVQCLLHSSSESEKLRLFSPRCALHMVLLLSLLLWVGAHPCHTLLEWCAEYLLHP